MLVYFLAEKCCALNINGMYLGLADGFERRAEINPSDGAFCELSPVGGFLPVRFRLDDHFLLNPPPQIRLYYTENAVAIYACDFLRADQTMSVLWQERVSGALLTLIMQGKVQLNIENASGFRIVDLPDAFSACNVRAHPEGFLLQADNAFALLSPSGETLVLSEGRVLAESPLKAEIPFHDSLGHTAVCEWRNGKLLSCAIRAKREPTQATFALALFESALIGADCAEFLSPALSEKAGVLKEYLGDYRSVVLTSERDKIGLVYERKERIYDVRYFRIETEGEKISNIKPLT